MKAASAIASAKFSSMILASRMRTSPPETARAKYSPIDAICTKPVVTKARPVPMRITSQPPAAAPSRLATRPGTPVAKATSARTKPMSR